MLLKAETEIGREENAVELGRRLAPLGADLLVRTLDGLQNGTIPAEPQDSSQATYAPILKKEDGLIDWSFTADRIDARIRGFQPWPGAYSTFRGQRIHIWSAKPAIHKKLGQPGSLHAVDRHLLVACGQDTALELRELQLEGRKRITSDAFRNGQRLNVSDILGEIKH
jgi:methionyl-tRNA formyltransferase